MRPEQRDSYLTRFSARVAEIDRSGDGVWLRLSRSAFYPTSGGQPHDTGILHTPHAVARVIEVGLREGEVWHRIEWPEGESAGIEVGAELRGEIDWPRRLRHMQRHSAQHLLSQAFVRLDEAYETRSVALGSPLCTIDFAGEPDDGRLHAAERLANEVAYRNLPIESFEIDERELGRHRLRRPPKVAGRIRLVRMGDFELSACGGTHLRSSAEAIPIKIVGSERVKGDLVRVAFRAGFEALEDYRLKHEIGSQLAARFSSRIEELPERIGALQQELKSTRRRLAGERLRSLAALAERLAAAAEPTRRGALVIHRLDSEADDLLPLARALVERGGIVALLAAADGDRGRLLFACSDDVGLDVRPLLTRALEVIGGRGGGRERLAQGAGSSEGLTAALAAAAGEFRKPDRP